MAEVGNRITSADVARRAGVSRTTVSLVLNNAPGASISEATRQRVLRAAAELNYHPDAAARSLVCRQTHTLGLVLCQTPDRVFADAFLPQVLHGVGRVAQEHDFKVLLQYVEDVTRPDAYVALVRGRHIDGIILSGPRSDDEQLPQLYAEGFPVVLLGQLPKTPTPFVDVDNVDGAYRATEHLIRLGHRRIGLITNAPLAYTASEQRRAGYQQALEAHGIPYDPALVRYGDFREESGYAAMMSLLDGKPPDAVLVASDLVAFGALEAIKMRGLRVPGDIALVGFDDVPVARYVDPPLTTIRLPAHQLGAEAARLVLRLIAGEEPEETQILLQTTLVVRDSCGSQ
ncbi:MAG: LacI family DNA-binding transcriptional regulator [Anaerolineae bacterium]